MKCKYCNIEARHKNKEAMINRFLKFRFKKLPAIDRNHIRGGIVM